MKLVRSLVALVVPAAVGSVLVLAPASAQEASPSASPGPTLNASPRPGCGAPPFQSIAVEPVRAAPGDTVTVTVLVRDEPCYSNESVAHDVELFAAREPNRDPAPLTRGTTDGSGRFVHVERATASTTYYLGVRDGVRRGGNGDARLTVDRTPGGCANALTLDAPSAVAVGESVTVHGNTIDTSTVSVAFRRRGQAAFTVRRSGIEPAGQQGMFTVNFRADDDYRLYASDGRCDSVPVLVQAAPVVTGPASVRRGSVVTLAVRATPGMPLAVVFRRSGRAVAAVRRTGAADSRGHFTVSYRADADYEYYAEERPGQRSAARITRAR